MQKMERIIANEQIKKLDREENSIQKSIQANLDESSILDEMIDCNKATMQDTQIEQQKQKMLIEEISQYNIVSSDNLDESSTNKELSIEVPTSQKKELIKDLNVYNYQPMTETKVGQLKDGKKKEAEKVSLSLFGMEKLHGQNVNYEVDNYMKESQNSIQDIIKDKQLKKNIKVDQAGKGETKPEMP